jgi:hypothetical protein
MIKEIDAVEPNAVADIPGPDLNTKSPCVRIDVASL